jgi:hypothetical protein
MATFVLHLAFGHGQKRNLHVQARGMDGGWTIGITKTNGAAGKPNGAAGSCSTSFFTLCFTQEVR